MIFISKISKCCKSNDDLEDDKWESSNVTEYKAAESTQKRKCYQVLRTRLSECLGKAERQETRVALSVMKAERPNPETQVDKLLRKFTTYRQKSGVPFAGELPVPIDKGRTIEVAGKIHPTATRFSVNLACGTGPLCDLAFHFNPRFDQNIIVRCYRRNGRWGEEECAAPARNPLKRGSDFSIAIFAGDKEFMVAINGKHYCSFAYRIDLLHIRNVELHGDVTLNFIDYRMTDVYPEKIPTMPEEDILTEEGILDSIATPYLCTLSTQFKQGNCIEIVGRVKRLPHSFYVNLQNGIHLWPHPTIALHINPRFRTGSQYSVILNSWVNEQWSAEETGPLLFTPGRPFLISIICRANYYNIMVDGVKLGQYRHRAPPELVTALFIQGDVIVKSIRMR